jgi:two-component system alkaline phosphatase synthesis response regulator PhoP
MTPLAFVVEDDESLADIFATTLQEAEYETEVASDGNEALARLNEITPHLVLLDLHLPGLSGEAILQHIRAQDRYQETWVALATADAVLADYLRRRKDRYLITLLKPISPIHLLEIAERLRKTIR